MEGAATLRRSRGRGAARVALACLAGAHILLYLWIAMRSIPHPYALEWMEGEMVAEAAHVAEGRPLYAAPAVDHVPHPYPPLYTWLVAAGLAFSGLSFTAARLLSLVSILGAAAVGAAHVHRETGDRVAALVAAGLLLATFELSGRWMHLARVDSLALLLVAASLYVLRFAPGVRGSLAAGGLVALAMLAKQTTAVALGPALAVAALDGRRRAAALAAGPALLLGGLILLHATSDGWSTYYLLMPLRHDVGLANLGPDHLGEWAPLTGAIAVVFGVALWRADRRRGRLYAAVAAGGLASALLGRVHTGGYSNVLMPAHFVLALLGGLACAFARSSVGWRPVAITLALLTQLVVWLPSPASSIPGAGARAEMDELMTAIGSLPKPVAITSPPFVSEDPEVVAVPGMAAFDLWRAAPGDWVAQALRDRWREAVAARRFATIILLRREDAFPELLDAYELRQVLFADDRGFPITGAGLRPCFVYVARGR